MRVATSSNVVARLSTTSGSGWTSVRALLATCSSESDSTNGPEEFSGLAAPGTVDAIAPTETETSSGSETFDPEATSSANRYTPGVIGTKEKKGPYSNLSRTFGPATWTQR